MSMLATVLKSLASSDEIVRDLKKLNLEIDSLIRNLRQVKKDLPASPEAVEQVIAAATGVVAQAEPTPIREPKNPAKVEAVASTEVGQKLIALGAVAALPLFAPGGRFERVEAAHIQPMTLDGLGYYLAHMSYVDQFGSNADCFDLDIFQFWRKDTEESARLKEHPQVLIFPNDEEDGCDVFCITPENYRKVRDVRDAARREKREQLAKKPAGVAAGALD